MGEELLQKKLENLFYSLFIPLGDKNGRDNVSLFAKSEKIKLSHVSIFRKQYSSVCQ